MPFNIPNDSEWVTSVRGISTVDQLEGGPGGVMNFDAVDLTKRTNWLKSRVDPLYVTTMEAITGAKTLVAGDARKAFYFRSGSFNSQVAYSPTCRKVVNAALPSVSDYWIDFTPPTTAGITGISVEFRVIGTGTWFTQGLPIIPNQSPAILLSLNTANNYEFRIITKGGAADGQISAIFNLTTLPATPITAVTLPAITSIENGTGFWFQNQEENGVLIGRVSTNGSDGSDIFVDGIQTSSVSVKPGRGGYFVMRDGSSWRVIGDSHRIEVGLKADHLAVTPPRGWLVADGRAVSRSAYADLFAVMGTTFGAGDGTNSFNLPDLRGEFIRGFDLNRFVDAGRVFGSAQSASGINGHVGTQPPSNNQLAIAVNETDAVEDYSMAGQQFSNFGSTQTHKRYRVRPRNIALLPCLKY